MFSTDGGTSFVGQWCYNGEEIGAENDGSEVDSVIRVSSDQIMATYATCYNKTSCYTKAIFVTVKRV